MFTAASTHFWWKFGKESDEQRIENAIELKKLAKKLAEKYNAPFLVSGDFNSGYAEGTQGPAGYEKMLELGFSDIRGIARNTTEEFTCRKDYPVRTDDDVYINGTMPM